MHVLLTVRKLEPGSYDDWRQAWQPDEAPASMKKAYILRNVEDPDEVIAFGMFESDPREAFSTDPQLAAKQRVRIERMAPYVAATGTDGLFEVVEVVQPAAQPA